MVGRLVGMGILSKIFDNRWVLFDYYSKIASLPRTHARTHCLINSRIVYLNLRKLMVVKYVC